MFPAFLTLILTQLSFQSLRLLFSHASAEVRGKNTLKRKFALTRYQTPNHQVISLTHSPLSQPGWTHLEDFLPFSSNMKLLSAKSFCMEESKICHLGKVNPLTDMPILVSSSSRANKGMMLKMWI